MPFKFLEDVSYADVAFEATGKTLKELFESSAVATFESMADTSTIKPVIEKKITLKASSVDKLLFNFLEEIVFLKDKDAIVFHDVKVTATEKSLSAVLHGDAINPKKQTLHQDVKAVTMHYFKVEHNKLWKANVVLDI